MAHGGCPGDQKHAKRFENCVLYAISFGNLRLVIKFELTGRQLRWRAVSRKP